MAKLRFVLLAGIVLFGLAGGLEAPLVVAGPECEGGDCIELTPASAVVELGTGHTLTATLSKVAGGGIGSGTLQFVVLPGGPCPTGVTSLDVPPEPLPRSFTFTHTCAAAGIDTLVATWNPGFENHPSAEAAVQMGAFAGKWA